MTALGSILAIAAFLACTTFFAANVMAFQAQRVPVVASKR
jgi:hypothetical protein